MSALNKLSRTDLESAVIQEVQANAEQVLTLELTLPELFTIIGNIQLALRHPSNNGPSREIAQNFIAYLMADLQDFPAIQEAIRRGNDPKYDVERK